jgi:hypothetical protein
VNPPLAFAHRSARSAAVGSGIFADKLFAAFGDCAITGEAHRTIASDSRICTRCMMAPRLLSNF